MSIVRGSGKFAALVIIVSVPDAQIQKRKIWQEQRCEY